MTANELLEKLQLSGNRVHSNSKMINDMIRIFKDPEYKSMLQKSNERLSKLPTDYQDSANYEMISDSFYILGDMAKSTEIVFMDNKIKLKPVPLFGTIDLDDFNAIVTTDSDEPLIVINEGLLRFTKNIIELFAEEKYYLSQYDISDDISEIFTKKFIDIMSAFHIYKNNDHAIPLNFVMPDIDEEYRFSNIPAITKVKNGLLKNGTYDETYMSFLHDLLDSSFLWIAAHEYSHLLLGHLENAQTTTRKLCDIDVSEAYFEWQQEYDADLLAAMLTMRSESQFYLSYGVYFALACLLLATYNSQINLMTHPPTKLRVKKICNYLDNYLDENKHTLGNYRNIDALLTPKFQQYQHFVFEIEKYKFKTHYSLQEFLYNSYNIK